jgi:hypothetical protein
VIKELYKGPNNEMYFQKSRVFLYPVLETKRGGSVTPINTYVSWADNITRIDRKLICTFYLRNDADYRAFEKNMLLKNELFHDFKEGENGVGIYIFDFDKHAVDFDSFLTGSYSRFKPLFKQRIMKHYNGNNANSVYVDSFINPNKYYEIYSQILAMPVSQLKGGELCDRPDFIKEHLKMLVKDLTVSEKSLDLPKL